MSSSTHPGAFLLVISGASGSGKSTVCERLVGRSPDRYYLSVSATTRLPRPGEVDGREYQFVDRDAFETSIDAGELLEHAEVFGQRYGTPAANLTRACEAGQVLLLDIDVQGGSRLRDTGLPGLWIWIDPPSPEELARRLRGRGTDSPESIARRLAAAEDERRQAAGVYDHFLVNLELDATVASIDDLVSSNRIPNQESSQR